MARPVYALKGCQSVPTFMVNVKYHTIA